MSDGIPCPFCQHVPPFKVVEQQQAPYRGMWGAVCAWEQEQNPDGVPTPLRVALVKIADEQPDAAAARAVRTTEYGGEPRHG